MVQPILTEMRLAVVETFKADSALTSRITRLREFNLPGSVVSTNYVPSIGELSLIAVGPSASIQAPWADNQNRMLSYAVDIAIWTPHDIPSEWERLWQLVMRALDQSDLISAVSSNQTYGQLAATTIYSDDQQPVMTQVLQQIVLHRKFNFRFDTDALD